MRSHRDRRGFTLLELLVVIAILALLMSLLMPAIHQSRGAARRALCSNNLRQMGLAFQSYLAAHGRFPPGTSAPRLAPTNPNVQAPPLYQGFYASYSWAVRLLPYLDQQSLYEALDVDHQTLAQFVEKPHPTRSLLEMPLQIFRCPLDVGGDTTKDAALHFTAQPLNRKFADGQTPTKDPVYGGTASYAGCAGFYEPSFPVGPPPRGQNNGILFVGSSVRDAEVTDGLSQTFLVGERAYFQGGAPWVGTANTRGRFAGGAGQCLGRTFWRINAIPDNPGVMLEPGDGDFVHGEWNSRTGFSSYHLGGANFLLADGSVRFISESIDSRVTVDVTVPPPSPATGDEEIDLESLGVYQRLGIRNDGLPTGEF